MTELEVLNSDQQQRFGITISSLPKEMRLYIFRFLDSTTLRFARLVSSEWKMNLDESIGYSVIINDTERENTLFAKSVVKTKIEITSLQKEEALQNPKSPHRLKLAIVSGVIHRNVIVKDLLSFRLLKTLILRGCSLAYDLGLDKVEKPIEFYSLTTLEFATCCFCDVDHDINKMEKVIIPTAKNLFHLLNKLYSRCLQVLIIDGDVEQHDLRELNNWKAVPLREFLSRHYITLEKIRIGESSTLDMTPLSEEADQVFPCNLEALHFSADGHQQANARFNYWRGVVESQTKLKYLNVGFLLYSYPEEILRSLVKTIVTLSVYYNFEPMQPLNMDLFCNLPALVKLHLVYDGEVGLEISNFNSLVSCKMLKYLEFTQCLLTEEIIHNLITVVPNMKTLFLIRSAYRKLISENYGINLQSMKGLLSLRNLEYLFMGTDDMRDTSKNKTEMVRIVKQLGEFNLGFWPIGSEPDDDDPFTHS